MEERIRSFTFSRVGVGGLPYGIMQDVAEHTDGELRMGAGTLYGTIQRLMDSGLVREVESPPPQTARDEEIQRLEDLVRLARGVRRPARSKA